MKEQAQPNSNLKNILKQKVGAGTGSAYKEICKICSQQGYLDISNPSARKASQEFDNAITGGVI